MNRKVYYKVVRKLDDGRLTSATIKGSMAIIYEIGKEIFPTEGTGGIFIFKDLEKARDFAGYCHNIYKCYVTYPRKMKWRSFIHSYYIQDFWKQYFYCKKRKKQIDINDSFICPDGSYLASSVTLIEKV